MSHKMVPL